MRSTFTRMVIPIYLGIAFGLFIGCSTLSSSTERSSHIEDNSLSKKELRAELKRVNDSLAGSPEQANPEIYYQKGYILSELAQKEAQPSARSAFYKEMQHTLRKADQLFDQSDHADGRQKTDELIKVRWSHEHNQGVEIIQTDEVVESSDYEKATAHFNNATIILPDSVISYKMKARAQYRNNQPKQAIKTLEEAKRHIDPLPSLIMEQLAFLYLETGQAPKAVAAYEEAESFSEDNLNLIHGLANAYISVDNHQKAVELLNLLVEEEPENIIYAQTRGTELYYSGASKIDSLSSTSDPANNITPEVIGEIDLLFEEAEKQLKSLLDANPDNPELMQTLAFFYKNSAAGYQRLTSHLSGDIHDDVNQKIEDYLQSSIPLFVTLTGEQPEEKALWRNLYQVYSFLDMDQKAKEIESKIL